MKAAPSPLSATGTRVSAASAPHQENAALGGLLIVIAFLCVAIMSALGKAATQVSTATIVFFQNSVSLLLFLPWALRHGTGPLKTSRIGLHVLRACGGLLSQVLMFAAVKKMPLMNAVLLTNSAPLFIPLITWAWLKEKITGIVWASLLIGFAGVILILKPSPSLLTNPAALIATSAAVFSAFALVTVNRLSTTETTQRILFYYFLISSVVTAPFVLFDGSIFHQMPGKDWLDLTGIGIFMAASQLLIILAYRHASAGRIAPFNYSVVIFSGLIGWIVWKNEPGLLSLAGVVLVTVGGILSTKFGGPNARGHFGWIGRWNHRFHTDAHQETT
ncbi:MAG TPA: DMT family transporter [Acidobacteriaceae bacterium]|nr:DMT family transporter [Acidobacteriaceae bacterium]